MKYTWWPVLTFFIGALLTWLLVRFGMKKGKKYEEVFDRVVEESSDESTKIRTLADEHAVALKGRDDGAAKLRGEHDAALLKLRGDHDAALVAVRKEHDSAVASQRTEATRLQGLVGQADTIKVDVQKQKDEFARLELDWKKKLEVAEAAATVNAGKVKDLEAAQAKALAEWDVKLKAAESKSSEVHGLLGTAKADTDKINADWNARFVTLEGDLVAARSAHSGCDARFAALEGDLVAARSAHSGCEARYAALESDHGASNSRIQGLTSQLSEASAGPDDLLVIEGIGPKINQALNAAGITRWKQVRDADQATLRAALDNAGVSFAPSSSTWGSQAAYLCDGDQVGFAAYTEYLVSGQLPEGEDGSGVAAYVESARARISAGMVASKDDLHLADGSDNLLIIEGIGPKFNQALLSSGISSFQQVAGSSEDQLRAALSAAGLSFAPSLSTWAKQAELLAAGDRKAFDEYVAFLVAGRDS